MKYPTFSLRDRITWMTENPYLVDRNRRVSRELFLQKFKQREFPYCFLLGSGLIEDCLTSMWWELEGKDLVVDEIIHRGSDHLTHWYKSNLLYDRKLIDWETMVRLRDLQRDRNNVTHLSIHNLSFLKTDYEINRFWELFRTLEDVESNLNGLSDDVETRLQNWVGGSL